MPFARRPLLIAVALLSALFLTACPEEPSEASFGATNMHFFAYSRRVGRLVKMTVGSPPLLS